MFEKHYCGALRFFSFFDAGDMHLGRKLGCAQGLE